MKNRFLTGLTSVTFRGLSAREIIGLAKATGLDGIEWGGDVHLPAGETEIARELGEETRAAGLLVLSYGSYYRLTECSGPEEDFRPVLATALALGAPRIRIWCGNAAYGKTEPGAFLKIAEKGRRIGALCDRAGLVCAAEYHRNTLTQDLAGAEALLGKIAHPAFQTYWQPNPELPLEEKLAELRALGEKIAGVHVFSWAPDGERLPLSAGLTEWREYLSALAPAAPPLILEFVRGDDPEQLLRDASALQSLCR